MTYEVVIGVEAHAQLRTQSKMFCSCGTAFGMAPNSRTCPVCLGLPGALPVVNRKAVEMAVRTGLALHCAIAKKSRFARKNYFYPDLPKGYQISQYESPICEQGWLEFAAGAQRKKVGIRRAHLEEDAGKNIHDAGPGGSRVDLNRAGTPLLEIVTEPDMQGPEEVVAYLKTLREMLVYLDVCDGNMEEGSLRCEPNVSLRPVGQTALGTKVELKNINSFRFVKEALEYEIKRQRRVLTEGGVIQQETRLWDIERKETAVMRGKEDAHDYRYFPDPDLLLLEISADWIEELRATVPELAGAKQERFVSQYGLPEYDAQVITSSKDLSDYFEQCVGLFDRPKIVSNWIMGELLRELNHAGTDVRCSPITPRQLVDLLTLVEQGTISLKVAREIFPDIYRSGKSPEEVVQEKGMTQISDEVALLSLIDEVVAKNRPQVEQYRAGKQQIAGFLVGQVMKASGGKANPGKVNELLRKRLSPQSFNAE
jgi:aspartyl-tRNA(Asn)/glutamyl-tRNA(Gln) amidotransferase subunit B